MIRYYNFDIVFAEIPDQTTLAINITGCPNRCPGCHSPHLRQEIGCPLDEKELDRLLSQYARSITCVAFMGGDADPSGIALLAKHVKRYHPILQTGWYSGRDELPDDFPVHLFDYIKLGAWIESLGPLNAPTTNQRLYRITSAGEWINITGCLRKK